MEADEQSREEEEKSGERITFDKEVVLSLLLWWKGRCVNTREDEESEHFQVVALATRMVLDSMEGWAADVDAFARFGRYCFSLLSNDSNSGLSATPVERLFVWTM